MRVKRNTNDVELCVESSALYIILRTDRLYQCWCKLDSTYITRQHEFTLPAQFITKYRAKRMSYRFVGDIEIYKEQQHVNVCLQSHVFVKDSKFYKISINLDSTRVMQQYKSVLATLLLLRE